MSFERPSRPTRRRNGSMGDTTGIAWTAKTWNPWQGCQKVSPGCENCYMFRDKARFGQKPEVVVRSATKTFNRPLRWQREAAAGGTERMVFLASWTDFFIAEADEWRDDAWKIIKQCPDLIFQILTKRHGRIASHLPADWGDGYPNVWLGVSAEDAFWWDKRVSVLREVPARVKFVSYEPAVGSLEHPSIKCSAVGIDWVIIGGESAPGREFDLKWASEAISICRRDGAAPFVKQLGSFPMQDGVSFPVKDDAGGDTEEWPESLRVREFPKPRIT